MIPSTRILFWYLHNCWREFWVWYLVSGIFSLMGFIFDGIYWFLRLKAFNPFYPFVISTFWDYAVSFCHSFAIFYFVVAFFFRSFHHFYFLVPRFRLFYSLIIPDIIFLENSVLFLNFGIILHGLILTFQHLFLVDCGNYICRMFNY